MCLNGIDTAKDDWLGKYILVLWKSVCKTAANPKLRFKVKPLKMLMGLNSI